MKDGISQNKTQFKYYSLIHCTCYQMQELWQEWGNQHMELSTEKTPGPAQVSINIFSLFRGAWSQA